MIMLQWLSICKKHPEPTVQGVFHQLYKYILCISLCLISSLFLVSAEAATPAGTVVTNTAKASYLMDGVTTTTRVSNPVQQTVLPPNIGSITSSFDPYTVQDSYSTVSITSVSNLGNNTLHNGIVTLSPPAGINVTVSDVYGQYTAKQLPVSGNWVVSLSNPLTAGSSLDIYAAVGVPFGMRATTVDLYADFQATSMPIVQAISSLNITNLRTPALIEFLHFSTTDLYTTADTYHAGQTIYLRVTDPDQNNNPTKVASINTVTITLKDSISGDFETLILTETGVNTGVFVGSVLTSRSTLVSPKGMLSVSEDSQIKANYTDLFDNTDTVASAVLVDPFGVVFDAVSGLPVDGVVITILNNATGLPAVVFGDDGVSIFPSTLTTGGNATDASGTTYNFKPGNYRFPFMRPGNYHFIVTTPSGYSFPSQVTTASIQALPNAPFAINIGSRGEVFNISAGPALNIDIPIDSKGVNLYVTKTSPTSTVGIGDRVQYLVNVENVHPALPSSVTAIKDTLPVGFRYQRGTAVLDGKVLPDSKVTIAPNGRDLTFNIGIVNASIKAKLAYVAVVGANTNMGAAVNMAFASGSMAGTIVSSNIARATVVVQEELIHSRGFIVGTVFVDDNMDQLHSDGELGIEGVRVILEDGRFATTDKNGRYHFNAVRLGLHIVQMDINSLKQQYRAEGLKNARFSKNNFSQFADVTSGGLVRANFRLIERDREFTPVEVKHSLIEKEGVVWANVQISQHGDVPLTSYQGHYILPSGWSYIEGTATLDGDKREPNKSIMGLNWTLDPNQSEHLIRLAIRGNDKPGTKKAVAYARFTSSGTPSGRTGMAAVTIEDTLNESRQTRSLTLNLKFNTRKNTLPKPELEKLNTLISSLKGLLIHNLLVEGHTDNIKIARNHRHEFANNIVLSKARAAYIASYIQQELKLNSEIVQALGKGAKEPIASNTTRAGRKLNRRVILKVDATKITHKFSSVLEIIVSKSDGKAQASWSKSEDLTTYIVDFKEKSIDDWVKTAHKEALWLFPAEGDIPSISSTYIYIQHAPSERVELRIGDRKISMLNYEGMKLNANKTAAVSYWRGVDLIEGSNHFTAVFIDEYGKELKRLEQNVHYSSAPVRAELRNDLNTLIADGKTIPSIYVQLFDRAGKPARSGIIGKFTVDRPQQSLEDYNNSQKSDYQAKASHFKTTNQGIAKLDLKPTLIAGEVTLRLKLGTTEILLQPWLKPNLRDWMMVGFGEGVLGYNQLSGALQPITSPSQQDKFYKDGRIAFYAKGKVKGDFLLTLAYDTLHTPLPERNTRFGNIDPNIMYTVYGDTSQQQFDASSSQKLYLKIERDTFYALFGDFNTGLSTTELSRYSRIMTGMKVELHEDALGFKLFSSQTSQSMVRENIRGKGISGIYKFKRQNIISNSETIRIETVSRFKSESILESKVLTRHLDYDIDYVLGTVWFKQPVLSKDVSLNPIYIIAEYEADDQSDKFTTSGGRVYVKPNDNLEIGGTFISESHLGGSNSLSGIDVKVHLNESIDVVAEAADSTNNKVNATAWKLEARMSTEALSGSAYIRQQDDAFGLGQQSGTENATFKVGTNARWRLSTDSSVDSEIFRQQVTNTGAVRDMAHVQYNKSIDQHNLRIGLRTNRDKDGAGNVTGSTLLNAGASTQITNRLSIRADHEQALSQNNGVAYPTRTTLGAAYRVTDTTNLSLTREWTDGQQQKTVASRLGVSSQPWNGAQLSASYEQQLNEGGERTLANTGLLQSWQVTKALSFSASIDQTTVISHSTSPAIQLNLFAPEVTGGEDFTAYSIGVNYRPESWLLTHRLEYRVSALSRHQGASLSLQGSPIDDLTLQFTLRWQQDNMTKGSQSTVDYLSLRAAWRPSLDALILLNRFDIRNNIQQGNGFDTKNLRYINNLTANWQSQHAWRLRLNHGLKLTDETLDGTSWSGTSDFLGVVLIVDMNKNWDITAQASALQVRHLNNWKPSAGLVVGYNILDDAWLGLGYNYVGFFDNDFVGADFSRKGISLRLRLKFDQNNLGNMIK